MTTAALQNWIPVKLIKEEEHAYCQWLDTGFHEYLEPFFEETISKCKGASYSPIKSVSSLSMLPEWSTQVEALEPTGFIFHVSRCGSTLLSQMLSLAPSNIVLSEVPFFDQLLQMEIPEEEKAQLLKAAIRFYGAKKTTSQKRLFIKLDSWHFMFYRQLRSMFPEVPFFILYRRPAEVIRSQQKRRGLHAVPGLIPPKLFGWNTEIIRQFSIDEYLARVLEKYFEAILEMLQKDNLSLAINYKEGPVAMIRRMAATIGFGIKKELWAAMKERTLYHSKNPGEKFSEETGIEDLPAYCDRVLALYESLEAIRCAGTAPAGI